ncbi:MAG: hypothetical protein ACI89W_001453 [Gammaproteobacteria bacterium]|jgi:hypothetical protein|tara:strand:+ start:919 stop:1317 length:399 start_codon:yes stop_codon:yes gene_type:complete
MDKTKISVTQSLRIIFVVTLLLCFQGFVFAQARTQEQAPLDISVESDGNVSSSDDILRLEETIRGNKEQPKVLSIVPWQLPLYQRIDRNEQRWAPMKTKLKSLERSSFLKKIKLLQGIQSSQSSAVVDTKNN